MTSTLKRPPYDPDVAATLAYMQQSNLIGPISLGMVHEARKMADAMPPEPLPEGVDLHEFFIPGYGGAEIGITVLSKPGSEGTRPAVFNIHGGGMIMGNRMTGISLPAPWAQAGDAVVVTVDYRLAPDFPDPYPVEDCYAALVWVAEHADELGIDPNKFFILGASAGAGLAAGVTLLSRDRGGPPLIGQMLICPMLDDRNVTVSSLQFDGVGLWDRASNLTGWGALLGSRQGTDDVSEYAAPARAQNLENLPPTFIDVGSAEVFRDEAVDYASRIWQAGGIAELHVWPGGTHGWDALVPADSPMRLLAARARDTFATRILRG